MPLPLTVSCFSKIQIGFTFLLRAHLGSPGKGPLNGCVCVCVVVLSADWRYRHAALMAISSCGEGCHQQMENVLSSIVEAILPFLQDSVSDKCMFLNLCRLCDVCYFERFLKCCYCYFYRLIMI